MNTKDLRWFREVVACGSISKAADRLYVSQQGLSKAIKNLEQKLRVPLLVRTPNGVEATPYGKFLYDRSGILLLQWDALEMEIDRMSQMERGFVRLCSAYGILRILSPDFVLDFQKKYPNLTIEYIEYPDLQVDEELEQGNCDVAFHVAGDKNEAFSTSPMFESSMSLLVYEDHPLAKLDRVSFQDLRNEEFIIESRMFRINGMFRRKCNEAGFEPNIIFQTSGFGLCHKLCQQKRGLSVVVDKISQDMTGTGLKKIAFEEEMTWQVEMICRKEFDDNKVIKIFKEYTNDYLNHVSI